MAKYSKIVKEIEDSIRGGELKAFDRLPTVVELTEQYHVSRTTIEQALNELERRGLVSRRRGSGVYVKKLSEQAGEKALNAVYPVSEDLGDVSGLPCEVYEFTVVQPEDHIRNELGLHQDSFTYFIRRSHMLDGRPIDVQHLYYPVEVFRDIRLSAMDGSVHDFLIRSYSVVPDSFHKTLRATLPDEEAQEVLGTGTNVPLLEVDQVGYLDDGRPFEYSITKYVGSHVEYRTVDTDSVQI